jgi:hypothetical protein
VLKRRKLPAPLCRVGTIKAGEDHTWATGTLGNNLSPWINNQAVTKSPSTIGVFTDLSRSDHPRQVLYRPGPQQRMPVCLSCWHRKS